MGRGIVKSDDLEIERFLQFKSENRNFKSEGDRSGTTTPSAPIGSEISVFGFKLQESFNFKIVRFHNSPWFVSD
jgi:hypothetical protein